MSLLILLGVRNSLWNKSLLTLVKGQGKVGHVEACLGMLGHVPAESRRQAPEAGRQPSRPIRSRHGALGHQSPLSLRFLPYMGARPGL